METTAMDSAMRATFFMSDSFAPVVATQVVLRLSKLS
jgi:hypothetical protein